MKLRGYACLLLCATVFAGQQSDLDNIRSLIEKGDRTEAVRLAREMIGRDPKNAEAQNLLGEALDAEGEKQEALEAFERASSLQPKNGQFEENVGTVLLELGKPDAAAERLDRAITLFGKNSEAGYTWYLRAKIYTHGNDPHKAASALGKAVALEPDLAEAWSDLGEARKANSDDTGALKAFQRAVELNPADAVAQYRLGGEYLRQDKAHLAIAPLSEACRLRPDDQSSLNALQTALRQDGKAGEANAVKGQLTELLRKKDEDNQQALAAVRINNEGAKLEKAGDLRGAAEKYHEALELNPQHVGIRVNFAVALLRLGQWTRGLTELHEASKQDPGNQQIKAALKDALSQAPPALIPKWNDR